ncbi:MAG: type I pantothenate kinase [Gemmatimonadales bacterium]|nr:MAG: type I pantothenate kinase [Gemmatimonadales bacterium]
MPLTIRDPSPFVALTRSAWKRRGVTTPMTLTAADLERLAGVNEPISLREVTDIYLPLSRLLNLHVAAVQSLHKSTGRFLNTRAPKVPYIIGVAGSVAVGKSTLARVLQALLARWPGHPRVDLVTTDGFLLPNRVLARRGLMQRKGFPESYDLKKLIRFLADVKSGKAAVGAPVYSHLTYDIVRGDRQIVRRPDVLILEGLTVLHTGTPQAGRGPQVFVSDFFDFSVYIDAEESDIRKWFVERFLTFRETAFRDPRSYFKRFATLTVPDARRMARRVWREINGPNLRKNILPTRTRANLILEKGPDHRVRGVLMRRL